MRLIDADYLKDWITCHNDLEFPPIEEREILRLIDDQPTAFDVDKVVERLEVDGQSFICGDGYDADARLEGIIDIVKGGVFSETD